MGGPAAGEESVVTKGALAAAASIHVDPPPAAPCGARMKSVGGRKVLSARRAKGRVRLAP